MGKKLLIFSAFICLLGSGMGLSVISLAQQQEKPQASATPVATPTPTPATNALSEAEVKEGKAAIEVQQRALLALNAALDQSLNVGNDAEAVLVGYRIASVARNLRDANANYNSWLFKVRKDHNCADCDIENGKLVPVKK